MIKILLIGIVLISTLSEAKADPVNIPAGVEKLVNDFMGALLIPVAEDAEKAILPYLHSTLINSEKTGLTRDVKEFGFKKAHGNAKLFTYPVKIERVQKFDQDGISLGSQKELGDLYKIFITKPGQMPAPLHVFIPKDGSKPMITYIGNL
ncbi:MAG: hypothetical protein HYU97_07490 [Deltaproteobacteria bacterium]|nr:hypothetical protein [Deltaproteobacteria bacterium]